MYVSDDICAIALCLALLAADLAAAVFGVCKSCRKKSEVDMMLSCCATMCAG